VAYAENRFRLAPMIALARSSPLSHHVRRFHHEGKSYIAYEGGVPVFKEGTLVASGYAVSVVADGHHPTPDELAAALAALEGGSKSTATRQLNRRKLWGDRYGRP
jgi:hypothetical protein